MKVLIIEDEITYQKLFEFTLSSSNIKCDFVSKKSDALALLDKQDDYVAIVIDRELEDGLSDKIFEKLK